MNLKKKENLANLLRETEKAHAEYEEKTGRKDDNWADWYAEYIVKKSDSTERRQFVYSLILGLILVAAFFIFR